MNFDNYVIENYIKSIKLAKRTNKKGKFYFPRLVYFNPLTQTEEQCPLSVTRIPVVRSRAGNEIYYEKAKILAHEAAQEYIKNLLSGATEKKKAQSEKKLSELADEWLYYKGHLQKRKLKETTLQYYHDMATYVTSTFPKNQKIILITPDQVEQMLKKYSHLETNTVYKVYQTLTQMLKFAIKKDYISSNVCAKVDPPPQTKKKLTAEDIFSDDEIKKIISCAETSCIYVPIVLGALFGLRRGEVLGLSWSDIDFDRGCIQIQHTYVDVNGKNVQRALTKSDKSMRTLPLSKNAANFLLEAKKRKAECKELCGKDYKDSDYVCCFDDGTRITPNYLSSNFKSFLKQNGIRELTFHSLRHYVATNLLRQGFDMYKVSKYMGHASVHVG